LGRFYLSQRKFAQAEAEMQAASNLAARDPMPRLLLADSYAAEGNRQSKSMQSLSSSKPKDTWVITNLAESRPRPQALVDLVLVLWNCRRRNSTETVPPEAEQAGSISLFLLSTNHFVRPYYHHG
jgi:hypothetical protein